MNVINNLQSREKHPTNLCRALRQTTKINTKIEQHTFKNVNNCMNINIYSYLEMSCGQSYNLYLNVVHFFNTSVD
jgi:hypothetical protein